MKHFYRIVRAAFALFSIVLLHAGASAQNAQLNIKDFSVYSNGGTNGRIDTAYGVYISSSSIFNGGNVGGRVYVGMRNSNIFNSDVIGGHKMNLDTGNKLQGNISLTNFTSSTNLIYNSLGSNYYGRLNNGGGGLLKINGNVDMGFRDTIYLPGSLNMPASAIFHGPAYITPNTGSLSFPAFPTMPPVTTFPSAGRKNITGSAILAPGAYGNMQLPGAGSTPTKVVFTTPGVYVFNTIVNTGVNTFDFTFPAGVPGEYKIYVHGVASLADIRVTTNDSLSTSNSNPYGSRIYLETHGTGTGGITNGFFSYAFSIQPSAGLSSPNWVGTVYAPNGGINIATSNGARVQGALWSNYRISLGSNLEMDWEPFNFGDGIAPYYPPITGGKVDDRIGSELKSLFANYNPNAVDTSENIFKIFPATSTEPAKVMVEVIAQPGQRAALLSYLTARGFTYLVNNGPNSLIITGKYPISKLDSLNYQPTLVRFARPLYQPITNSGLVTTLGDSAMKSGLVRSGYDINGSGVKVGVISDSYDRALLNPASTTAENDLGEDLPASVEVLVDYPFGNASDEGRAMMQIVHDVAPGADLAFRTGFISAGDMAQGINELANVNCNVIVDDVTYITEPFLKDGVIAKAVNNVVTSRNISYFSAAGNFGKKSYEAEFTPVAVPAGITLQYTTPAAMAHDFGGGSPFQPVVLQPGNYTIALQWLNPIYSDGESVNGTDDDLDIYLLDAIDNHVLFGFNRINLQGDPLEVLPFRVNGFTPMNAKIMIVRSSGNTSNLRIKYIVFRGGLDIPGYAGASTLVGQANAENAIAVGAVLYNQTPAFGVSPSTVEDFSSRGGTLMGATKVNRNKPDLVAPDGGNVTVNIGPDDDADSHANFYGTSAAAPHAAAVAALIREAKLKFSSENITQADLKTLLKSRAANIGGTADERGSGLLDADAVMRTFANPKPTIISIEKPVSVVPVTPPALVPGFTVTIHGNNFSTGTEVWIDGLPPIAATSVTNTEIVADIPSFTGDPAVRLYTPPLVSGHIDGGFSNPMYFFHDITNVQVVVQNQNRKYGQNNPPLTAKVYENGVEVGPSQIAALGLSRWDPLESTCRHASLSIL